MITRNGIEYRNLVEQVQKNKEDIARHYEESRVLADYGITIVATITSADELPDPLTYTGVFGDAYAVGPEGGPYEFYIYTRPNEAIGGTENRWLNIGQLAIAGPQGPQGETGPQGPSGTNAKWYSGNTTPVGSGYNDGDMFLSTSNISNGNVYRYGNNTWTLVGNILGPQGIQGPQGNTGPRGNVGPQGPQGPRGNPAPVVEILGTLTNVEQLPSDTSGLPSNAAYLVTTEGVNYLYIIIEGVWTNSGRWGGGSAVYESGQFVESFDADTKVNTVSALSSDRVLVYTNDYDGTTPTYSATKVHYLGNTESNFSPYSIAMVYGNTAGKIRPNGSLITDTPVNLYHAANKSYVDSAIRNAHSNTEIFHLGVFGAKTDDVSTLPLYNIPVAPLGSDSNIQLKCDLMVHDGSTYINVPVPTYIQFTMISSPDLDGNFAYAWNVYEVALNSSLVAGTGTAMMMTDTYENATFQINDDQYYNEAYITIHCPHNSSWYFPTT